MNLRAITANAVGVINPPTYGDVYISTGATTDENFGRTPVYGEVHRNVRMDVQALTERDIFHIDALNVSGTTSTIYISQRIDGLVRRDNKGGDLIYIGVGPNAGVYLVTGVLEIWPDWCKAAVTLQVDRAPPQ